MVPDSSADTRPIPSASMRAPVIPSVPVENIMRDLWVRGAALTEANRSIVAGALTNRRLAYCGLCLAPASAIGTFTPHTQPQTGRMRTVFYGVCTPCRDQPDYEPRIEARISAGDSIGYSVDLDLAPGSSHDSRTLERAEWIKQFSGPDREWLWDRVSRPEKYGLEVCSCCQSRPMAVLGCFNPGTRAADGLYSTFLYALCLECYRADGHARMVALAQARMAAREGGTHNRAATKRFRRRRARP